MDFSLHPFRVIEGPLTFNFNTIIFACQSLSRCPYVCLARGRCTKLLISFNLLISSPVSMAYNAPMWHGVKPFSWKPFIYTHPDF